MKQHEPWSDERLAEAFGARAAEAPTPIDLATSTIAAVRTRPDRRPHPGWRRLLPIAAAVAVAVVLVRPLSLKTPVEPDGSSLPTTSGPPAATARAGSVEPPREVTVADLIERGVGLPSDEEVIVRGWLARSSALVDCAADPNPQPLVPHCEENLLWLMDSPESQGRGGSPPQGAIVPILRADAHVGVSVLPGSMIEVVAVGHQGDHRWATCVDVELAPCFDRFVIDQLLPAGADVGVPGSPWIRDATAGSTEPRRDMADIIETLQDVSGPLQVVSIGFVSSGNELRRIEPILAGAARDDVAPLGEAVWMVRAITADSNGAAWTYLVSDDPSTEPSVAFLVTETGVSRLDGSAQRFAVQLDRSLGGEASRVVVVDRSWLVDSATVPDDATRTAIYQQTLSGDFSMADLSTPGRLYVGVQGGMCDRLVLTIDAKATLVSMDRGPSVACRLAGVSRLIQLDFADPSVIDRLATSSLAPPDPPGGPTWPPKDAQVVTFPATGPDLAPIQVAVVDKSGLLESAARPNDALASSILHAVNSKGLALMGRLKDADDPGRMYLTWEGGLCDQTTITIDATASSLSIDPGPSRPCFAALIRRTIQLDFSDPGAASRLAPAMTISTIDGTTESPG